MGFIHIRLKLVTYLNIVFRVPFLLTSITRAKPPASFVPTMHSVISAVSMRMR